MGRITDKEMQILRELSKNPEGLYGLQIVENSNGRIKRGSVYVFLSNLKEEGYVVSIESVLPPEGQGGLARPIYRITGLGELELEFEEKRRLLVSGVTA